MEWQYVVSNKEEPTVISATSNLKRREEILDIVLLRRLKNPFHGVI